MRSVKFITTTILPASISSSGMHEVAGGRTFRMTAWAVIVTAPCFGLPCWPCLSWAGSCAPTNQGRRRALPGIERPPWRPRSYRQPCPPLRRPCKSNRTVAPKNWPVAWRHTGERPRAHRQSGGGPSQNALHHATRDRSRSNEHIGNPSGVPMPPIAILCWMTQATSVSAVSGNSDPLAQSRKRTARLVALSGCNAGWLVLLFIGCAGPKQRIDRLPLPQVASQESRTRALESCRQVPRGPSRFCNQGP